jgi:1-pyrroline-5-carboxylate dehydrogenase
VIGLVMVADPCLLCPFGGARGSGTNDKAGSYLNLIRWVSPRTIKETFLPPTDHRYPFLG